MNNQAKFCHGAANGSAHPWHKRPRWQKRIHGWLCYQMQSWVALLWPKLLAEVDGKRTIA